MQRMLALAVAVGLATFALMGAVACGGESGHLGALKGTSYEKQPVFGYSLSDGTFSGDYTSGFQKAVKACGFGGVDDFVKQLGRVAPGMTRVDSDTSGANGSLRAVRRLVVAEGTAAGGWSGRITEYLNPDSRGSYRSVREFKISQVAAGIFEFTCIRKPAQVTATLAGTSKPSSVPVQVKPHSVPKSIAIVLPLYAGIGEGDAGLFIQVVDADIHNVTGCEDVLVADNSRQQRYYDRHGWTVITRRSLRASGKTQFRTVLEMTSVKVRQVKGPRYEDTYGNTYPSVGASIRATLTLTRPEAKRPFWKAIIEAKTPFPREYQRTEMETLYAGKLYFNPVWDAAYTKAGLLASLRKPQLCGKGRWPMSVR
ncbi:MAG: hypothetical protein ACXVRS_13245 [Gaiellaceae bacterium]